MPEGSPFSELSSSPDSSVDSRSETSFAPARPSARLAQRVIGPITGSIGLGWGKPAVSPITQPIKRVDSPFAVPTPSLFEPQPQPQPKSQPEPGSGTAQRGLRQPGRSVSRLPLVAGALALLIVLGAVGYGIQRANSGPSAPGTTDPSAAISGAADRGPAPGDVAATKAPTVSSTDPQKGAESKVKLGVFVGTSRTKVDAFEKWLGRDADYVIDFSSRSTWDDIANPDYMIDHWRGSKHRMVYSVALRPWNGNTSIKAGARGEYDRYFRTLASNLVAGGQEDAILRLGWEFNLKGWKWSSDNPKDFIGYWRHIVTAMRSVPGQKLRFDWNPNVGETPYEAYKYYPGGKYVDYIGIDVYDVSWAKDTYPYGSDCDATCRLYRQEAVWDRIYAGHYGLLYWADFARDKGKPMSLPEWGLWDRPDGHGGGDNAYFIKQMHAFVDDPNNRVAYQGYLQMDVADGKHKLNTLKQAGQAYKKLFK